MRFVNLAHRRFTTPSLAAVLFTLTRWAAGETGAFEYVASDGCASREHFVSAVQQRLPRDQQGDTAARLDASVAEVRIELERGQGGVWFRAVDGPPVARYTAGSDCEELVTSVALICAIALSSNATVVAAPAAGAVAEGPQVASATGTSEPLASEPAATTRPQAVVTATPAATTQSAVATQPAVGEQSSAKQPTRATAPPRVVDPPLAGEPRDVVAPSPRSAEWALGAAARVDGWSGPGNPLGAALMLAFAPSGEGWSARGSFMGMRSQTSVDGRGAQFQSFVARAEVCAAALAERALGVDVCLAPSGGVLFAYGIESSGLLRGASSSQPWADVALLVRASTRPLWGVQLEAQAELGTPLIRHEFEFDEPQVRVFQVEPRLAPALALGLRVPL